MTSRHWLWIVSLVAALACSAAAAAVEEIPGHRQKEIREAAPEKPRVEPAVPRTVLVFNTPDHL